MAPGKKPTKADKSNVKKRTVTKKPFEAAKKTASSMRAPARGLLKEMTTKPSETAKKAPAMRSPAKKNAVEKASSKRTPARGLLKQMTKKTLAKSGRKVGATTKKIGSKTMPAKMSAGKKKMPAKKATSLKKGNKKAALTKKISSKMNSAKMAAGQGKKIKKTPFKKAVSGKNKEALTKKIPNKMNSAKATSGQKKATKKTAGMKNPVIVIKSVDVSPSSSENEKKIPKEEEEKEMRVEVSSADDDAASQGSDAKSQKAMVEENSGSASSSMASSSSSMGVPTSFDLATFVESRLGAINSPSVAQELSGSEKSTLADLINHNMRLAHNLYEVEEETILETALVSLLPDFEVEEIPEISSVAKAAHREIVQFRDLLLLQKVETISEAQRTGWNLAAPNLSDAAQVALLVNLLGLAMKLTGLKPVDSVAQAPGGKVVSYNREEVEAYLAIFDSVTDEIAEGWKEGETNLPVKRRMLADLNTIIQNF